MIFREIAARVLCSKGYNCTPESLKMLDDREICRMTGLPVPCRFGNIKKSKKKSCKLKPIPSTIESVNDILFEGFDKSEDTEICHLHVDEQGLKHSLKCMDKPNEIIISTSNIRVKYEFEFDNGPYIRAIRNTNKKGLTRKDVAIQLAGHYQKFFKNRAKYGLWVQDISSIGISAITYNRNEKVYELYVDLTH